MQSESTIHTLVCKTVKYQYPKVIFWTDLSGIKLNIGQAKKIKSLRSSRAIPDLFFPEPRGNYSGLFIELKTDGFKLFKKDGTTPVNNHIQEQIEMLSELKKRGFMAKFVFGYNDAMRIIEEYLKLN